MSIVIPKWRTYDSDAVQPDPLTLSLLDRVQPEFSRSWDLIPWSKPLTGLDYKMASRAPEGSTVVSTTLYTTGSSTTITFDSATRKRLTAGHILYHSPTKQVFVIDSYDTTTGVATLERVDVIGDAAGANVAIGQTFHRIGHAEHYDELNATSRFGSTTTEENYIQDSTERLDFSRTFLGQQLNWGMNEEMLIDERIEEYVKDLNKNIIYGVPSDEAAGQRAATAGFDHVVAMAGNEIDAAVSGTPDMDDIKGVARFLQANGAGVGAGTAVLVSPDAYYEYEDSMTDFSSEVAPEDSVFVGLSIKGVTVNGVRYPFYMDPTIIDNDVRFVSTRYARKAYYQDNTGKVWNMNVIDEESESNFKNKVSYLHQKWGTIWQNADKVHAKLVTGF
ncbi:MAG TPA: hypothetical protein VGN57_19035 [Pirellulaceae bacterium]|jgi:hypothetical protein|nr:hypothetical protein [Pirellulaceae bacterium]